MYYKWLDGRTVKSTVGRHWGFPEVDIRAEGGYVVGPGSYTAAMGAKQHEGMYNVHNLAVPVPMPPRLVEKMPFKNNVADNSFLKGLSRTGSDASPQNPEGVIIPDVIPVGERDALMYRYIGKLVSQGLSRYAIAAKAREAWAKCEQPQGNEFPWTAVIGQIDRSLNQYRHAKAVPVDVSDTAVPDVRTLNDALQRYCLIESGSLVADLTPNQRAEPVRWGEFKLDKSNIMVTIADDAVRPLPDAWLHHAERKRVHGITYYPKDTAILYLNNISYFNRYVPSPFQAMATYDPEKIKIPLAHLAYLLADDSENMRIMEKWLAYTVKRPAVKIPWAPLIITTEQGTGKGWFKDLLMLMVGQKNFGIATPEELSPNQIQFNGWIGGVVLLFDEMKGINAKLLNHIVTETWGTVNPKYRPKEERQFFCNVIGFSNDINALLISQKDRRWWIHDNIVAPKDQRYYNRLYEWLTTDGVAHFVTYLWSIDTSGSDFLARPPMTQGKLRMIDNSIDEYIRRINDAYELKQGPLAYDIVSTDIVMEYVQNEVLSDIPASSKAVGRFLNTHLRKCILPKSEQKYTVIIGAKVYRKRLIAIRNPEKWRIATDGEVVEHYSQHWKEEVLKWTK